MADQHLSCSLVRYVGPTTLQPPKILCSNQKHLPQSHCTILDGIRMLNSSLELLQLINPPFGCRRWDAAAPAGVLG